VRTDLVLERVDGILVATWSGSVTELRLSSSPDDPGDGPPVASAGGRVELGPLDPRVRHYVHARADDRWVVAGERLVPLDGALNFRDLGGYPTVDGRHVRWGRVYRSDGLQSLTDGDHAVLEALGIATACDLRAEQEHEQAPSRLPRSVVRLACSVSPARPGEPTLDDRILGGELAGLEIDDVVDLYLLMLDEYAPSFGAVFARIADAGVEPVLFHCAAGKDRTGIVAALLLALLGVADDEVFDDYMLTQRYRTARRMDELRAWLGERGLELEPFAALYIPQRQTIERTVEAVRARHGSVDAFLTGPAATGTDVPERLRHQLLTG
jgi:protein-tyrosine phosphatase